MSIITSALNRHIKQSNGKSNKNDGRAEYDEIELQCAAPVRKRAFLSKCRRESEGMTENKRSWP